MPADENGSYGVDAPPANLQPVVAPSQAKTPGHWSDGGSGTWVWIPGSDGMGSTTPPPVNPPPSATGSAQGINNGVTAGVSDIQSDITRRQGTSAGAFQNVQSQIGNSSILTPGATTADPRAALANLASTGARGAFQSQVPTSTIPQTAIAPHALSSKTAALVQGVQVPNGPTTAANSQVATAGNNAKQVLGNAPTVDMGIADRHASDVTTALGQTQQVVDQALAPVDQTQLNQSISDARGVLNQLLNGPNTADRIGAQTLRSQLALARSAAGGPGAVQEALSNAQQAAPELEAQAAQAGTAETMQRLGAAGNVAGALGQTTLGQQQNVTSRIGTAATAASGAAGAALGASGQDVQVASKNVDAASALINDVSNLTGTQLTVDEQNKQLIGQMARDAASMDYNWGSLSAQQQDIVFDTWVKTYNIDVSAAAQIKAAAAANHKSTMDYVMGFVGAAATLGASAVKHGA